MQSEQTQIHTQPARRKLPGWLLAFGIALLAAGIMFLPFIIYEKGNFFFFGDFNVQQIPFYRMAHDAVRSGEVLWNSYTDLGANFIASYSFYLLFSPFFWLTLPFPSGMVPYLMAPLLMLKTACMALTSYFYIRRFVRTDEYAIIGSLCYAFSGFATYNIFFNHFHEAMVFFPLLLIGVEELVQNRRRGVFALAVAVNCIVNYWFFIGEVVFVVLYVFLRMTDRSWGMTVKRFCAVALESVLGLCLAMVVLLPSVLAIMGNPRTTSDNLLYGWNFWIYSTLQRIPQILQTLFFPPELPSRPNFFPDGGAKWSSLSAWLPLFGVSGTVAFLLAARRSWLKKLLFTCLIMALVPGLNSAFILFNNSYYARWFYMPVLILAAMTVSAWEDPSLDLARPARSIAFVMIATLAFALVPVQDATTKEWSLGVLQNPGQYCAVLAFGLSGLAVYHCICRRWQQRRVFARRLLAGVLAFSCLFGIVHIGIGKFGQWNTDSDLVEQYINALALKEDLPEGDWRIDTYKTHDNLGLWLDKSCLQYFGSTAAPSILSFYPALGVKRDVRSQPELSNYALRGLLSVRYLLTTLAHQKQFRAEADEGWAYYDTLDGYVLYENQNYVPMGFTYDYYLTETQYEDTVTPTRSNLLMRALVLTEEDAVAYGQYLTPLPTAELNDLTYTRYTQDCADRRASACTAFEMTSAGFHAEATLDRANLMFFSVPYDDGFTAYVDGQETEILRVDEGLMAVLCPAGTVTIDFVYQPDGIRLSRTVTLAALPVFLLYAGHFAWDEKKRRKH